MSQPYFMTLCATVVDIFHLKPQMSTSWGRSAKVAKSSKSEGFIIWEQTTIHPTFVGIFQSYLNWWRQCMWQKIHRTWAECSYCELPVLMDMMKSRLWSYGYLAVCFFFLWLTHVCFSDPLHLSIFGFITIIIIIFTLRTWVYEKKNTKHQELTQNRIFFSMVLCPTGNQEDCWSLMEAQFHFLILDLVMTVRHVF